MRASLVVNRQSTWRSSAFVAAAQAATSSSRRPGQRCVDPGIASPGRTTRSRPCSARTRAWGCGGSPTCRPGRRPSPGERLVERGDRVGVEVVHDQHDLVRVGVLDAQQMVDAVGPVDSGAGGLGVGAAPTAQGFGPHEDRAGAVPDVFGVLPGHLPGRGRRCGPGVASSCSGFSSMTTTGRPGRRGGRRHPARPPSPPRTPRSRGRDGPTRLQVRLKRPLFRTRPIVEWSIGGIPSVTATCLSSNRSVHR